MPIIWKSHCMSGISREHIDLSRLQVRRMEERDLEAVLRIERQSFKSPWTEEHFLFEIRENRHSLPLVLCYEDEVIGYAVCWKLFEEFHLANIAIDPKMRGMGLGEYLLDYTHSLIQDEWYYVLEVRVGNEAAIRLYEKKGFSVLFRRKNYYPDGEDAYLMIKYLKKGGKNELAEEKEN